jgi:hypothetical protein
MANSLMRMGVRKQSLLIFVMLFVVGTVKPMKKLFVESKNGESLRPYWKATVIVKPLTNKWMTVSIEGLSNSQQAFGTKDFSYDPETMILKIPDNANPEQLFKLAGINYYLQTKKLKKGVGIYKCLVPDNSFSAKRPLSDEQIECFSWTSKRMLKDK